MLLYCIPLIGITAFPLPVTGQSGRVLIRNAPEHLGTAIEIKWFSQSLVYDQGVNVYRSENGGPFIPLNSSPIQVGQNVDPTLREDVEVDALLEIMDEAPNAFEGLHLLNLFVKSFESNLFAQYLGVYLLDSTVREGLVYSYRVMRIEEANEHLVGQSGSFSVEEWLPEGAVENFGVIQSDGRFEIDWSIDEDRFYAVNIYRRQVGDANWQILNRNPVFMSRVPDSTGAFAYPVPKYIDTTALETATYQFSIAGLDYFGDETARTSPVTVEFIDTTPPPPPMELRGKADSSIVTLGWRPSESPDLSHHGLFRSALSEGPFQQIFETTLDDRFIDSIAVPGPYYYYLSAFDHHGNESRSRKIFVEVQDVIPPARPVGLEIFPDTGAFRLKWENNVEADLGGYLVYRTVDLNADPVLINVEPRTSNSFTYRLPDNVKNEFYFKVVAVDTLRNKSAPSEVVAGVLPDVQPPEQPMISKLYELEDGIAIEWVENVDADLAGYTLQRADSVEGPAFESLSEDLLPSASFRYVDRSTKQGQSYLYRLLAVDSAGNWSEPSVPGVEERRTSNSTSAQLEFNMRYRKRQNTNILIWEITDPTAMLGFVLFKGNEEDNLRPITGLTMTGRFVEEGLASGDHFYMVKAYFREGAFITSHILELNVREP